MKIHAVPLPGQTLTGVYRVKHGDGHYVWIEVTTRGVFDTKTGEYRNLISVSRDVTERVTRELEIKAAQERARNPANKAKSRFLANMSHELRTPLNAVIGFTDLMRQRTFGPLGNERYEEYATLIYDSGQLLLDLISDMLDMAKIEAGKLDTQFRTRRFARDGGRLRSPIARPGRRQRSRIHLFTARRTGFFGCRQARRETGPAQPSDQCHKVYAGRRSRRRQCALR